MAESTSGNGDKDVERVPSFSKFLRSPLSPKRSSSKQKRSSSALSRLNPVKIFGRKKSGTEDDELIDPSLVGTIEEVAQVIENTTYEAPLHYKVDEENLKSSTETNEEKKDMNWGEKVMQQVHALEDEVKEGLEKAKENVVTTLDELISGVSKDKLPEKNHQHEQQKEVTENKLLNEAPEATPTLLPEPVSEHIMADHVDTTQPTSLSKKKEGASKDEKEEEEAKMEEKREEEKEKEKEDDCVSSLAQGIQKLCAPWSTKKED